MSPTWITAGLSPFTCNTGGVAEESAEDDAAAEPDEEVPDWGVAESFVPFEAFAAATIAWNCAGVTHVEPTHSSLEKLPVAVRALSSEG